MFLYKFRHFGVGGLPIRKLSSKCGNCVLGFFEKVYFGRKGLFRLFLGHYLDKFGHFGVGDLQFGIYIQNVGT